jgi:WD40 repeat protein
MKVKYSIVSLNRVIILALLLSLVPALPVFCGEPSKEPELRLETGMHTDLIGTIGVDAKNHFLVSGSMDKTVRVWELPGGRLVATLRPPIEKFDEGKINAVDISPDGSTIVAAGSTGYSWEHEVSIYIFDRLSGEMKKRIKGLPEAVVELKFSPDGKCLVAGLAGAYGIRIYNTADWSLLKPDPDYGNAVKGLNFDGKGRLVTVAQDGLIRFYDAHFQLPPKMANAPGGVPSSVAFSLDGSKIAISYRDSVRVDVYSTSPDLRHLFPADTTGVPTGPSDSFHSVCWTSDGSLYAGGNYRDERTGTYFIRKWADGGKGRSDLDLPASKGSVFSLLPLKNGAIAFACVDGIGVFDSRGRKTFYRGWDIPDSLDRLLVSDDAKTIQFCFDSAMESAARFSLARRIIELKPEKQSTLKPAISESQSIKITDARYDTVGQRAKFPKLNGRPLKLFQDETSYSFAICPGGQTFLLGTAWNIRLFDKDGSEIWRKRATSIVWSINVASNGVFIASHADGTIRWHRVKDGKEFLAFFVHRDNKHWVLWTPKGYYDASIGAENLVGWHVNKSIGQVADFFAVSRFRSTYYRPDIIQEVLNTHDEDEAVKLANKKAGVYEASKAVQEILPPVVEIISPADNSSVAIKTLTIRYRVRSPRGEPVTGIRLFVDGGLYKEERGLNMVGADIVREIQVDVPGRDCEISIVANNVHGWGADVKNRVRWAGTRDEQKGVLYVVAVGVSDYQDKGLKKGVKRAAKDAIDFAEYMKKQNHGSLYQNAKVKVLPNDQATRDSIMTTLSEISKNATGNDLIILFLSGHGEKDESRKFRYLLADVDEKRLPSRYLSHSDIKDPLVGFPGRRVVFIDTCRSGSAIDIGGFANELASSENGRIVVFTSATGDGSSEEPPELDNGAFTKVLLTGLEGQAANKQKKVTASRLHVFLEEEVPKLTGGRQKPDYIDLGGGALELVDVLE